MATGCARVYTCLQVKHAVAHVVDGEGVGVGELHHGVALVPADAAEDHDQGAHTRHGPAQQAHHGLLALVALLHRLW